MKSILWGNYKGGVGKTTTAFQVGAHFASMGKRVLLMDLDPQCSLSNICSRSSKPLESFGVEETLNYILEVYMRYISGKEAFDFHLLSDEVMGELKSKIHIPYTRLSSPECEGNLYFIPSVLTYNNSRLNEIAQRMSSNVHNIFLMKLFLNAIIDEFDYIFFDCPPTTNILIQSVFLAADYYVLPTICDEISTKGVADYIIEIESTQKKYEYHDAIGGVMMQKIFGAKPQFIGVLGTLFKGRKGGIPNTDEIIQLDTDIEGIPGVSSLLSQAEFSAHRYRNETDGFDTHHIFRYSIAHKDNRTSGESIPQNTSKAETTPSYETFATALLSMIEGV